MTTKLTLSLDESVIKRAKHYAKHTGMSLSQLIENYLDRITSEKESNKLSPGLQKIVGAVKLPDNFDEEQELRNYMENKHL
jgi:hypothetical protein